ncbi:SAVED domain-containing protein [Nocardia ninae]|uniref:SMODS-associated and fused to various effectors domain-containing protein n=1 Tax=Nocardia ninae NBRC 108245 TaxID=1210091 RepID=A0A511MF25_9NOCA|nr:SAVED domain-containing protein [Nocardia ninae]GEM38456.1 hypothetical protein NN4_29750 [Nocardia ninae NBRC 108245]
MSFHPRAPQLTILGTSPPTISHGHQALQDGTIAATVGGIIAGGFGVEAAKSFVTTDEGGRWYFVAATLIGIAVISLGTLLRQHTGRRTRVAIVITAPDAARGLTGAAQLDQQAERYAQRTCTVALKTAIPTTDGQRPTRPLIEALADETLSAITLAERLTPDATQFHLIPTMPLHAGFWFGTRLGSAHARDIRIHQTLRGNGTNTHFDAISLRTSTTATRTPLTIEQLHHFTAGEPTHAALALDLENRGATFDSDVNTICVQQRISIVLTLRNSTHQLNNNPETFEAAVAQISHAWRNAGLTPTARSGRHTIFLSGALSIAIALGARLAAAEHGRWQAFTFNRDTATYEQLPTWP